MGSVFFIVREDRDDRSLQDLIPHRMQEIANGTHSYQLLNEIMPLIYKRFTDKTAEEWRQIYKVRYIESEVQRVLV